MGWRSSRVHLARLMHRTGSSNGRVGHEYLINNYYRGTLFLREKESCEALLPHLFRLHRFPTTTGPGTPLSLLSSFTFTLSLSLSIYLSFAVSLLPPLSSRVPFSLPNDVHRAAIFAYL